MPHKPTTCSPTNLYRKETSSQVRIVQEKMCPKAKVEKKEVPNRYMPFSGDSHGQKYLDVPFKVITIAGLSIYN